MQVLKYQIGSRILLRAKDFSGSSQTQIQIHNTEGNFFLWWGDEIFLIELHTYTGDN